MKAPKRLRMPDAATEARNRWLYERCCAGVDYRLIVAELAANARGWRPIKSKQGIYCAAMRYAERHALPRPPQRPSRVACAKGESTFGTPTGASD